MNTYTVKHYRRQAPHDSPKESLIAVHHFEAENDAVARMLKDGLLAGFNDETDFAVLLDATEDILWRDGVHL